jgi:hypothetical protein
MALRASPLSLPARPPLSRVGSTHEIPSASVPVSEATQQPHAEADGDVAPAPPAGSFAVPGLVRKSQAQDSAIASDLGKFQRGQSELQAQEELSVGAEALAAGKHDEALTAFQKAGRLDGSRSLGANPLAGEATALARLGECERAVQVTRDTGKGFPNFGRRGTMLRETAQCFSRRGDAVTAQALSDEARAVDAEVAAARANPEVAKGERASALQRVLLRDSAALRQCEQTGLAKGELPGAAGSWRIEALVDEKGKVSHVSARGPRPAPELGRCLESTTQALLLPTFESGGAIKVQIPLAVTTPTQPLRQLLKQRKLPPKP